MLQVVLEIFHDIDAFDDDHKLEDTFMGSVHLGTVQKLFCESASGTVTDFDEQGNLQRRTSRFESVAGGFEAEHGASLPSLPCLFPPTHM